MMFAIRREVLDDLFSDSVWTEKMKNAETMKDMEKVIVEFCKARGYKIGAVEH